MFSKLTEKINFMASKYLQTLYSSSIKTQTPFFTVNSDQITIIEDPLDFYLLLKVDLTSPRIASLKPLNVSDSAPSTLEPVPSKDISLPQSRRDTRQCPN